MRSTNDNYVIFTILGFVEKEEDKFFRWAQWSGLSELLAAQLHELGKDSFYSSCDVLFDIPLKPRKGDAPGTKRVTSKNVPLGRLKWLPEHHKKWTTKLEEELEYPVSFLGAVILSSKDNPPAVQLVIKNMDSCPMYNQVFSLAIHESNYKQREPQFWTNLVSEISIRMNAVRIGKTIRPWTLRLAPENGFQVIHSIGGVALSGMANSLDLDQRYQRWKYLK